jgi:hypothetical protein
MNENYQPRAEKPFVPEAPRRIVTLSHEYDRGKGVLRLKRCDGVDHWYEEQSITDQGNGKEIVGIEADDLNHAECDCPDKNNRVDVMDIFKN